MRVLLLIAALCHVLGALAQGPATRFTENKGQWPDQVLYRAMIPGGALFVERDAMTYVLTSGGEHLHHGHEHDTEVPEPRKAHAYRVTFEGSAGGTPEGKLKQPHYENYFIGNDPQHWGSGCGVYGEVWVKGIYPGVDLRIDGRQGLKYDLVVAADGDPSIIRMRYEGQEQLGLEGGALRVKLTTGDVVEEAPVSWSVLSAGAESQRIPVRSSYRLRGNLLTIEAEASKNLPLIIDPNITFGSYSGSTADNFGFTATYDNDGHLYGGGIVFGIGYPTTLGVLDPSFNGNTIDVGISKWTPDGTSLVWSTYLGGSTGNETPHSLVVNDNDELYVLGATGSTDFATTGGCFDPSFNGGTTIDNSLGGWNGVSGYGYSHMSGTDIFVSHFNAGATALLGSTYVGGNANDGLNNWTIIAHNYGDPFRGEIVLDNTGTPVVLSSTESGNIPTTPGAAQAAFGGMQDAYLFKMNTSLTSMVWATYYGGGQRDAGYGIQLDSNDEVFITGGTMSIDLPMAGTPSQPLYSAGADGYLAHLSSNGTALLDATFIGTSDYDQSYKVQLNTSDEVFVFGQTHGSMTVTPGKYANPGSSQFIQKFDHSLSNMLWGTLIGNGNGAEDLSPSAFLVTDCGQIYVSGWGGLTGGSSTSGFPTTPGAFQTTTDGSDFYLMVLEPEAVALNYATFFGGSLSNEHVDGGTSRFDKNGNVYQAVCAGCGSNSDFPTTPGAWSNTNNSNNCNLGVFKFNLNQPIAQISISGPATICLGTGVSFDNLSVGGNTYNWWFGDGNTSLDFEPVHTYSDTGSYTVMMVLTDLDACTPDDTAYLQLDVIGFPVATVDPAGPLCPGDTVQLQAYGGDTYVWDPPTYLSNATIDDPLAWPDTTTTYNVIVGTLCGTDTATLTIQYSIPVGGAGSDTVICIGGNAFLSAFGGVTYSWSPAGTLNNPALQNPIATPLDTTDYIVTITTAGGCVIQDTTTVIVQTTLPVPVLNDTATCPGQAVQLLASGGDSYAWDPAPGINDLSIPDPFVTPPSPMYYVCTFSNACGSVLDSAFVDVVIVIADAWPDTLICPGQSVTLFATGGITYEWSPPGSLDDATSQTPVATPSFPTNYQVIATGPVGCTDTAYAFVDLFPLPTVYAGSDVTIDYGDATQLQGVGQGAVEWTPDLWMTGCTDCLDPWVSPETSTEYTITLTDTNGCKAIDVVFVIVDGSLYVPNTFTPNGDGVNDMFLARGLEIDKFELFVFNRWGEQIWQGKSIREGWNGTYSGVESPIDTYVWKLEYSELSGEKHKLIGHVNLVR